MSVVNKRVRDKMVEWRQTITNKYSRTVHSQLVGWNTDAFDIPLWQLQTDEHQGEGEWGKMFLHSTTGLVSHTDLYRVTPHAGLFGPKSVKDIQVYMTKEAQRGKKKTKYYKKPKLVEYDSTKSAMFAYLKLHLPEDVAGVSKDTVVSCLRKHDNKVSPAMEELIKTAEAKMATHKQQLKAEKRRQSVERRKKESKYK